MVNKKRKQIANNEASPLPTKRPKNVTNTRRKVLAINDLPWKEEEIEGFMGLQVVEGVQIAEEGDNLQFYVDDDFRQAEDEIHENADNWTSDFEGFSDNENDDNSPKEAEANGKDTEKDTQSKKKSKKSKGEFISHDDIEDVNQMALDEISIDPKTPKDDNDEDNDNGNGKKNKKKETQPKKDNKNSQEKETQKPRETSAPPKKSKNQSKNAKVDHKLDESFLLNRQADSCVFSTLESEAVNENNDMSAWNLEETATSSELPSDKPSPQLLPSLLDALAKLNFTNPTDIQRAAIPRILEGRDVVGKAATGTGKTLAFGLPIIQLWLDKQNTQANAAHSKSKPKKHTKSPSALIISPTRELARQITTHLKRLCELLPESPYVCSITGGLALQKQERELLKADIVVGTPGRLWEVINSSMQMLKAFKQLDYIVIDEADRVLSEGSFDEAKQILTAIDREELAGHAALGDGFGDEEEDGDDSDEENEDEPLHENPAANGRLRPRQTLIFSATFNKTLQQKLSKRSKSRSREDEEDDPVESLRSIIQFRDPSPLFIDVNPVSHLAPGLQEGLVQCDALLKDLYLCTLLFLRPLPRTLVFVNSIHTIRRMIPLLQVLGLQARPIHSEMQQKTRLESIEWFSSTKPQAVQQCRILIATDVAARGIDVPNMDRVIHYHVPRTADTYVHRSGRTARAGRSGISILICTPEEALPTRRLISKIHESATHQQSSTQVQLHTIRIDPKVISDVRRCVTAGKTIADAQLAREKHRRDEAWGRDAADKLGLEYDGEEMEAGDFARMRGAGRKKREEELRLLTNRDIKILRAELKSTLSEKLAGNNGKWKLGRSSAGFEDGMVWEE